MTLVWSGNTKQVKQSFLVNKVIQTQTHYESGFIKVSLNSLLPSVCYSENYSDLFSAISLPVLSCEGI